MNTTTTALTYTATLRVWSAIGHTPITKRKGSFCDELAKTEVEVANPAEAKLYLAKLASETKHAVKGYFEIPSYPNQNTRTGWSSFMLA
jgi:hypothetical protein